jgi:hypothetical protein
MAIDDIKKSKIGQELQNWVYLGVRAGMLMQAKAYILHTRNGESEQAEICIKHAVDIPTQARARIDASISQMGRDYIVECIASYNVSSIDDAAAHLDDILSDIDGLIKYSAGLVDRRIGGESWDNLATDILTNVPNEVREWTFIEPKRQSVWGD